MERFVRMMDVFFAGQAVSLRAGSWVKRAPGQGTGAWRGRQRAWCRSGRCRLVEDHQAVFRDAPASEFL